MNLVSTTIMGRQAEQLVAEKLKLKGFSILAQNWRTRKCEIDIVARKNACIYFVEVKYRSTAKSGSGFDYISLRKQWQMHYAAEVWCAKNRWDSSIKLCAAEVDSCKRILIRQLTY